MAVLVRDLIEGRGAPVTVMPSDSVLDALEKMIRHDYSQLPIVDDEQKLAGVITSDSILRISTALGRTFESLRVSEAKVKIKKNSAKYGEEDDVFDLLDELRDNYAVPIVDEDDHVVGIVTSYDASEFFRQRAEHMMRVEDIELALRSYVEAAYKSNGEWDPVVSKMLEGRRHNARLQAENILHAYYRAAEGKEQPSIRADLLEQILQEHVGQERKTREFDELDFSEYQNLLLHKERWSQFQSVFGVANGDLRAMLNKLRETRNQLFHFRGEISARQGDQLLRCRDWLTSFESDIQRAFSTAEEEPAPNPQVSTIPKPSETEEAPTTEQEEWVVGEPLADSKSRYAPLAQHLMNHTSHEAQLQLSFGEVEGIIQGDLPAFARQHRSWWANDTKSRVQSMQWLGAGWRVGSVDIAGEVVVFKRIPEQEQGYKSFFDSLRRSIRESTQIPVAPTSRQATRGTILTSLPASGPRLAALGAEFLPYGRFAVGLRVYNHRQGRRVDIAEALWGRRREIAADLGESSHWGRREMGDSYVVTLYRDGSISDPQAELEGLQAWATKASNWFVKATEATIRDVATSERDQPFVPREADTGQSP
jgi:hypothetical protein